jgi:hypothetical protein
MKNLRVRAVLAFGRLMGVPLAVHQSFLMSGIKVRRSRS